MTALKSFFSGLGILAAIFVFGTILFSSIESVDLLNSFYYVLLTITTVGPNYHPTTIEGKIFTMVILFFGIGTVLYIATFLTRALVEGESKKLLQEIKMGIIKMKSLKEHVIVCGYGRTGKHVCNTLKEKGLKHVVIEKDTERCKELIERNENVIQGDAEDPEVLRHAYIENAKCLIATLENDADNIYLIMTAKEINPKLVLAARAQEEAAVDRLRRVGASVVVQPQIEGGRQLVNTILKSK